MNEFQDINIIDLNEEKTRRNFRKEHLMDFYFRLSGNPTREWEEIFREKLIRNRTTRNALMEASVLNKRLFKINPKISSTTLGQRVVFGDEIQWTAKERNLEKHFKILQKCVEETNQQYARLVRQKLKQQERDRRNTSTLRDRLFGKKK